MFTMLVAVGIFLSLVSSGIIPGKKADDLVMWVATGFCLTVGGLGLIFTIKALIKEKIAKKRFKEKGIKEEEYIPEEVMVFKNAIPELRPNKSVSASKKPMKNYIFKQVGSSIIKYKLFDNDNNVVCDTTRLNKTFFEPLKVSFNNHVSNKSFTHIIGRALIGSTHQNEYFLPTGFSFRTDGLTIDDYCKMLNIQMSSVGNNKYDIIYNNLIIGNLTRSFSKKIDWLGKRVDPIEINCIEDYLDVAFFLAFAIGYCGRMSYNYRTRH